MKPEVKYAVRALAAKMASGFAPKGEDCFAAGKLLQRMLADDVEIVCDEVRGLGRVVELYDDAAIEAIEAVVGHTEMIEAVRYLTSWNMSYPKVILFFSARDTEVTATYYKGNGEIGYCIGAVYHAAERKFGFHS